MEFGKQDYLFRGSTEIWSIWKIPANQLEQQSLSVMYPCQHFKDRKKIETWTHGSLYHA